MKTFLPFLAVPLAAAVLTTATTGCMSTADANTHRVAGGAVPIFHKLDANNDAKVTYAEFDAGFADSIFDTYDKDSDGVVTLTNGTSSRPRTRIKPRRRLPPLTANTIRN